MTAWASLADIVIGPHSALTEWVFSAVSSLAQLNRKRNVRQVDRFDQVDLLSLLHPVLLSFYPSAQVVDIIENGDARVIYVADDPMTVQQNLAERLGLTPTRCVRAQTASAVANLAIGRSGRALIIERETSRDVLSILRSIVAHLEIRASDVELLSVLDETASGISASASLDQLLSHLQSGQRSMVSVPRSIFSEDDDITRVCREIMAPLIAMARGDVTRPVVWPTPVFTFADRPVDPAPLHPEVSGPVRNLYYGPYFHLPPALYRVEAILAFSDEIAQVPFLLEMHGGTWLVKARIGDREAGAFRGHFLLDHREPTATVEVRLRNEDPIIKGRLSLIDMLFFVDVAREPRS